MAYDESLAERIRRTLAGNDAVTERRMFGGLCFLVNGRMCCGIVRDMLMARIPKSEYARVIEEPHVRPMDFTGRPLSGFVYVEPEGIESARALRSWITRGLEVAAQSDAVKKKPRASTLTPSAAAARAGSPRINETHTRHARQRSVSATRPVGTRQVNTTAPAKSAQPAGYSGTPLAKKLGIVSGSTVSTFGAPANYADLLAPMPDAVRFVKNAATATVVHIFTTRRAELANRLARLYSTIQPGAAVWVSWPKKASKVETDITEDVIREIALPLGFVDVKVCAVDEVWSGLKLVIRVANRPKPR